MRSIYVQRRGKSADTLENSLAVLVTNNSKLAQMAYEYEKSNEGLGVSSVITDFSLANMAWLKGPMKASLLPKVEVIAFAYAALQPTKTLLDKYLVVPEQVF